MLDEIFGEDEIITSWNFWVILVVACLILTWVFAQWGNKGFEISIGFKVLCYALSPIVVYILMLRNLEKNG